MFTGIITEIGAVESIDGADGVVVLTVRAPETASDISLGDSVAINGVCLTVIAHDASSFSVEVVGETIDRSNLGDLVDGTGVNLERPLPGNGRFDGHIVQGHVDGTGHVADIEAEGHASRVRTVVGRDLAGYIVEKGSITVDGVSLTVTAVSAATDPEHWFEVVLIPHTLAVTVLGERRIADTVNLETDILAKYIERMMEMRT